MPSLPGPICLAMMIGAETTKSPAAGEGERGEPIFRCSG